MRPLCPVLLVFTLPAVVLGDDLKEKPTLVLDVGGHVSRTTQLFFTPDGERLVSTSTDKTVRIWETSTGESVSVLRFPLRPDDDNRPSAGIQAAALSPDGRSLAVAGHALGDDHFYVLDLAGSKVSKVIKGPMRAARALTYSPDGKVLAIAGENGPIRQFDAKSGQQKRTLKGHSGAVMALAYAPDGNRIASGGEDGILRLWSLESGKATEITGHKGTIHSVAWSADGQRVASWDSEGGLLIVNPADASSHAYVVKGAGFGLAFSRDAKRLLAGDTLVDPASGKQLAQYSHHSTGTRAAALSPDGRWVAWGGITGLAVWDSADPKASHKMGKGENYINEVSWRPDAKAVGWRVGLPREVGDPKGPARSFDLYELKFGPAPGKTFLRPRTTLGNLALQAKPTDHRVAVKNGDSEPIYLTLAPSHRVHGYTFLDKGRALVAATSGLFLYDVAKGQRLRTYLGVASVWSVAPTADNRYLASGGLDQVIRIYDPERPEPLLFLYVSGTEWITWTSEGYYAASPGGEKLMGWQVTNGADELATFLPAAQFRKALLRPDVITRVLETGSVAKALEAADKETKTKVKPVEVDQVLPPRVESFASVAQKESKLQVKVVVESVGKHPVTELQLLLDDRPYVGPNAVRSIPSPHLGKHEEQWTVDLPPGTHQVIVVAFNSAGTKAVSRPLEATYAPPKPPDTQPHLRVLAIGINDYPGDMRLDWAVNDARELASVLAEKSKPLFAAKDGVKTLLLTDEQAKRTKILQGLTWLKKEMRPQDVAVVFFAGHGYKDPKGRFYLLAHGADASKLPETAVGDDEFKKRLAHLPGRVLVMLDACHSGQIGKEQKQGWAPGSARKNGTSDDLVRQLADDDCGVIVMCAALGAEESLESKEMKHGYFTKAILDGLSGQADKDKKGSIQWAALDYYVGKRVPELTDDRQHPATAKPSIRSFPLTRP